MSDQTCRCGHPLFMHRALSRGCTVNVQVSPTGAPTIVMTGCRCAGFAEVTA